MKKNITLSFFLLILLALAIACGGSGSSETSSASDLNLQLKAFYDNDGSRFKLSSTDQISIYELGTTPSATSITLSSESVSYKLDTKKDYVVKLMRNGTYFMKTLILSSKISPQSDTLDIGTINAYTTLVSTRAEEIYKQTPSGEGAVNQALVDLFGDASLDLYGISLAVGKASSSNLSPVDSKTLNKMILCIATIEYLTTPASNLLASIENGTEGDATIESLYKGLSLGNRDIIKTAIETHFIGDTVSVDTFINSLTVTESTDTTTGTGDTTTDTTTGTGDTTTDTTTGTGDTTTDTTTGTGDTTTEIPVITPQISGTIRDVDGNVISGALVQVIDIRGASFFIQSTSSSSTGEYAFSDIPAGTYYILVDRSDFKNTGTQIIIN